MPAMGSPYNDKIPLWFHRNRPFVRCGLAQPLLRCEGCHALLLRAVTQVTGGDRGHISARVCYAGLLARPRGQLGPEMPARQHTDRRLAVGADLRTDRDLLNRAAVPGHEDLRERRRTRRGGRDGATVVPQRKSADGCPHPPATREDLRVAPRGHQSIQAVVLVNILSPRSACSLGHSRPVAYMLRRSALSSPTTSIWYSVSQARAPAQARAGRLFSRGAVAVLYGC
jgi:hypothetical protein